VSFSDGTRVEVEPSSRARVAEVSSRGARVVLEDGVLDVDVVHKDGARWTFQAGPYSVNVTGTSFTLRWSAADDRLDVEMKRGSVVVEGPLAAAGVAVVGGQTLDARLRDHTLSVTDADASGAVAPHDETAAVDTSSVERSPMPVSSATEVHALNPLPTRTWSADIAAGDYARIVSEAEEGGLDGVLERRPLADLTALADAARYVRRQDVARRALEAQRSRFPTSKEANAAAFLLGRMAEEAGDSSGALGDYDAYLAASVDGPFAAEALGRKLALLHAQGRAEARPAAEEYLRRFPTGAYARVAHDVVTP
jgi:TolA-binding protein